MAQRTTPLQRRTFYERHQAGQTYSEIARHDHVSKECVRYWCRRQRTGRPVPSPRHPARCGCLSRFDPKVRFAILRLRLEHPHWGPNRIRARLKKRHSVYGLGLPSDASIGRYLHQWQRFRRPLPAKPPYARPHQPTAVHQRWQIDFKVGIALKQGLLVNLHTVRDPVGEACLGAQVFLAGRVGQSPHHVTLDQVRAVLRTCFAQWGTLPQEIQTDGETVLTGRPDAPFPSVFTLWLIGLGIQHLVIRPGQPTDNAEVERCHRTLNDYGIVGNEACEVVELQAALTQTVYELAFELPSRAAGCRGQPPIVAHPELLQPPRPFRREEELAHFDLGRVDAFLATFTWKRKVDCNGQITLAGRHTKYSVGRQYAHQEVEVKFDPQDRHYVFYALEVPEQELGRRPARGLDVSDLTGLAVWPSGPGPQQLRLPLRFELGVNC